MMAYTKDELEQLYSLVSDAAEGDPGEAGEAGEIMNHISLELFAKALRKRKEWIRKQWKENYPDFRAEKIDLEARENELIEVVRELAKVAENQGVNTSLNQLMLTVFDASFCPVCGGLIKPPTEKTTDGRWIGVCGDAFTDEAWRG